MSARRAAAAAGILTGLLVAGCGGSPTRSVKTTGAATTVVRGVPLPPSGPGAGGVSPGGGGDARHASRDTEPLLPPPPVPDAPPAIAVALPAGPLAPVVYKVPTPSPVVFVTIDDGWYRDPGVVAFFRRTHWPVSTFLIQRAAGEDPSYFRSLQGAGAVVQDHTVDHPRLAGLPYDRQRQEICDARQGLGAMFGSAPTLFRPPYGAYDRATQIAARSCGLSAVVEWNAVMSGGSITVAGRGLGPGSIILMHFRPDLVQNLNALEAILGRDHLAVGRLESYLKPLPAPAPGSTTTSSPKGPATTTTTGPPPSSEPPKPTTTATPTTATPTPTTTASPV